MPLLVKQVLSVIGWLITLLIGMGIVVQTIEYFPFDLNAHFLRTKSIAEISQTYYQIAFYAHITLGPIILLLGMTQFWPHFRRRFLNLHRWFGKIYVFGLIFICAPGALIMSFNATGGLNTTIAFLFLNAFWVYFTWKAWKAIKKGDLPAHLRHMTRSYAITWAAVALRLYFFIVVHYTTWDEWTAYKVIAWVSWVPNLIVVEYFIWKKQHKTAYSLFK